MMTGDEHRGLVWNLIRSTIRACTALNDVADDDESHRMVAFLRGKLVEYTAGQLLATDSLKQRFEDAKSADWS